MFILIKKKTIGAIFFTIILIFLLTQMIYSSVKTVTEHIDGEVIVIDPGHGGYDPGASGSLGKPEKDINLQIALKLKDLFSQNNYKVMLTRSEDIALNDKTAKRKKASDVKNRKKIIESCNPKLLISIHLNSFPQKKYFGAQVFYPQNAPQSRILGEIIQSELRNIVDNENKREAKSINTVALIKGLDVPAVVVECGFLSNVNEEKLLNTNEYQQKLAEAILSGVKKYLSKPETQEQ